MRYQGFALAVLGLSLLLPAGCGGGAYGRAERADSLEAWRAFLADPSGEEDEIAMASARLDALAWAHAQKTASLEGYKRYLEEVPRAAHRAEAETAMAELRFARLGPDSSRNALEDYLRRHPEGARSSAVRERLTEVVRREALEAAEIPALERWLTENSRAPGREEVEALLDRLRFEAASSAGTTLSIQGYLARFPRGLHREAAEVLLAERALRAARYEGRDADAEKILAAAPLAGKEQLAEADAQARLERALRRLDPKALSELATETESPVGEKVRSAAEEALTALGRGKRAAGLSSDARTLDAPVPGLGWSALEASLESTDARRRRVGARALGYCRSTRGVPLLVDLLEDRDLQVAWTAADALRRLANSLDPLVRDVVLTERLHVIEPRAASPARRATVAILREAAGAGGVLPRLRAAAEGGARLADLRLMELSKDPRTKMAAMGRLAVGLRERTTARLTRLEESLRGAAVEPADLRAGRSALWLGGRLLSGYEALVPGPRGPDDPQWVADLSLQRAQLETLLPRVEGRYRLGHPTFLADEIDEGAARRSRAASAAVEAASRLAAAGPVASVALESARRSPHPQVRAAVLPAPKGELPPRATP